MDSIRNLTIRAKLYLLACVLIGGLLIYGVVTYATLQSLKVKGPYYERIIMGKDIIADILPPPAYIIEAYLLTFQELSETDPSLLEKLVQRSKVLKDDYFARHQFWLAKMPEGHLKDMLINESYAPAVKFFDLWEKEFLIAILSGNKQAARTLLEGPMKQEYEIHRRAIDEVVKFTNEQNAAVEAEGDQLYRISTLIAVITWVTTILLGILCAGLIAYSITKQLQGIVGRISAVSYEIKGKMDQQAQNIVQQSASVHETTTTMDELNTSFQHTESLALEASNKSKRALQVSAEGNQILRQMLDGLLEHKAKVTAIIEQIGKFGELIHQIHTVAAVTSNLTNQTNVVALNAAVQAAHVKQHSEGFSVIASEIRRLADESRKFLTHIEVLSGDIQNASDTTILIAEAGTKTMQGSIDLAQATKRAFEQVMEIIPSASEGAEQVSLNVKQQSLAVSQVLEAMESLNTVSQDTITATEKIRGELQRLDIVTQEIQNAI